jgi:hypothetical protein
VPVTLVGLKGVATDVVYSLYHADNMAPLANWIFEPENRITAASDSFTTLLSMWIQMPGAPGTYEAVINLVGRDGEPLAGVRTKPFTVSRSSRPVTAAIDVSIAPLERASKRTLKFNIAVTNRLGVKLAGVRVADKEFPRCGRSLGTLAPGATIQYKCLETSSRCHFVNHLFVTSHSTSVAERSPDSARNRVVFGWPRQTATNRASGGLEFTCYQ